MVPPISLFLKGKRKAEIILQHIALRKHRESECLNTIGVSTESNTQNQKHCGWPSKEKPNQEQPRGKGLGFKDNTPRIKSCEDLLVSLLVVSALPLYYLLLKNTFTPKPTTPP